MTQEPSPAHVGFHWLFERFGAGRSERAYRLALWRAIRSGRFPAPLVTADKSRAWRLEDVNRWEQSLQPVSYAPQGARG
jgi:hypothetical protein